MVSSLFPTGEDPRIKEPERCTRCSGSENLSGHGTAEVGTAPSEHHARHGLMQRPHDGQPLQRLVFDVELEQGVLAPQIVDAHCDRKQCQNCTPPPPVRNISPQATTVESRVGNKSMFSRVRSVSLVQTTTTKGTTESVRVIPMITQKSRVPSNGRHLFLVSVTCASSLI